MKAKKKAQGMCLQCSHPKRKMIFAAICAFQGGVEALDALLLYCSTITKVKHSDFVATKFIG